MHDTWWVAAGTLLVGATRPHWRLHAVAIAAGTVVGGLIGAGPIPWASALAFWSAAMVGGTLAAQSSAHRLRTELMIVLEAVADDLTLHQTTRRVLQQRLGASHVASLRAVSQVLSEAHDWTMELVKAGTRLKLAPLRQLGLVLRLVTHSGANPLPAVSLFVSELHREARAHLESLSAHRTSLWIAASLFGLLWLGVAVEAAFDPKGLAALTMTAHGWLLAGGLIADAIGLMLPWSLSELP